MCGIAGIINIGGRSSHLTGSIKSMTLQMRNRGPDDEGYLFFDGTNIDLVRGDDTVKIEGAERAAADLHINDFNNEAIFAFGHRRLSILDLSARGHQPMPDETGRYWIVYNGEVYNFQEIRSELSSRGIKFSSNSDTEVILKSYIQWGEKCLDKFNGMFAFAIFDQNKNSVFFARDRVGIKPLYYTIQNGQFIFASDIKTIIASQLYKPEVNWEGMWYNFSFYITPRPMTAFKDIHALEQSHYMYLNLDSGEMDKNRYWQIPVNTQDMSITEKDAVESIDEQLTKSVKYRLISDVEVGTFMSGGTDSTLVSAIASRIHPGITAFTLGYDESMSEYDEVSEAKKAAEINDINHIVSYLDANVVLDNIDEMVLGYEEPFKHLAANYVISRIVKENGLKVILSGLGGDELFAGYGRYRQINMWKMLRNAGPLLKLMPFGINDKINRAKILSGTENIGQYYSNSFSLYNDIDNKKLFNNNYNSLDAINKFYLNEGIQFADDIEALSYFDMMNYIGNHHVHRTDQFTMIHSIEGRVPFLDHNLIETAFRIPSMYKVKNNTGKYILKKVAEKYIPQSSIRMKKKGFTLPLDYWLKNDLLNLANDSVASLKNRKILNNTEIDRIVSQNNAAKIWQLVMFELWHQKFIDHN